MSWIGRVKGRSGALGRLLSGGGPDDDLSTELRHHIELEAEDLVRHGWEPEAARREAFRRFGGEERTKERVREARGGQWLSHLLSDFRLGARRLLRTPGATLTALTALAIGIGLSALMFSLVDGGVLPTLPVQNGERIMKIQREGFAPISAEAYQYWDERQGSFEGMGATVRRTVTLAVEGEGTRPIRSAAMTVSTLPLLSVQPAMGRGFTEDDATPGAPAVALVGWETWRTRLQGDPDVLGRTIRVNGVPVEIVGVMPEGFEFPWNEQLWTPLPVDALRSDQNPERFSVFGMLRERMEPAGAAAEMNSLEGARPRPADELQPASVEVLPYTDILNPSGRLPLLAGLMLGVAFLVLLVACANATNVLLARAAVRSREVALRAALGASRMRIAVQFWVEASVLAFAGAVGGGLLAWVGVRMVRGAMPADDGAMPYWFDLRIDLPVLLFVAAAAVLTGMMAGVLPALHASRVNRQELLKDASRGTSSRRIGTMMGRLIGVELAVSFVLLVASGLFVRSAVNLQTFDFSFDPEGVYTARVSLPDATYEDPGERTRFIEELEGALAAIPGASSAAAATQLPGVGGGRARVAIEGVHTPAEPELPSTLSIRVTPGYFEAFGPGIRSGRSFDAGDRIDELPVALVNESFERTYLPGGAVGRRVAFQAPEGEEEWRTIVGVAPDLLAGGLDREVEAAVYVPLTQDAPLSFLVAVRARTDAAELAAPIRETVASLDSDAAVFNMRTLRESIDLANAQYMWLSALFLVSGGLALFLAAVGLYGVMAFWVAQRTREIGVRMAMGGARSTILGFVLRQGMARIALGLLAGALLAVPVAWVLQGALLEVRPFDPVIFGGVLAVLLATGCLGCFLPALRATHVEPSEALAAE